MRQREGLGKAKRVAGHQQPPHLNLLLQTFHGETDSRDLSASEGSALSLASRSELRRCDRSCWKQRNVAFVRGATEKKSPLTTEPAASVQMSWWPVPKIKDPFRSGLARARQRALQHKRQHGKNREDPLKHERFDELAAMKTANMHIAERCPAVTPPIAVANRGPVSQ